MSGGKRRQKLNIVPLYLSHFGELLDNKLNEVKSVVVFLSLFSTAELNESQLCCLSTVCWSGWDVLSMMESICSVTSCFSLTPLQIDSGGRPSLLDNFIEPVDI